MKIYIAGFYQSAGQSILGKPATLITPQNVLESYHYIAQKSNAPDYLRAHKRKIFLDSGAFSMFTQGVKVDLKSYAKYIATNQDVIEVASNLDAIGQDQEKLSYDRQKELEGFGVNVKPVHHARDRDTWIEQYLTEGYDYIFLGGMVPESTPYLRAWLDHLWHNFLTDDQGKPLIKVHGFGITNAEIMFRYPWYSVDSTSWVKKSRFGMVLIDLPQPDLTTRDYIIDFSSKSMAQKRLGSNHFVNLDKATQHLLLTRIEQLEAEREKFPDIEKQLEEATGFPQGYNQKALAESYGWRDNFNIAYFARAQERAATTFKRQQGTLFA